VSEPNGHNALIADILSLLADATACEFHDFKNTTYATPKIELCERLTIMARKVRDGAYDNEPDDADIEEVERIIAESLIKGKH
jgi:hypothetical protein